MHPASTADPLRVVSGPGIVAASHSRGGLVGRRAHPTIRRRRIWLLAAATLLLSACSVASFGPTPRPTAAPRTFVPVAGPTSEASAATPYAALPAGLLSGRVGSAEAGIAITLASGWRAIPLEEAAFDEVLATLGPTTPFGRAAATDYP